MKSGIFFLVGIACLGFIVYASQRFFSQEHTKQFTQKLLAKADIQINGSRPWDIHVHNDKLYERVVQEGSLGLGESYMDGWWDCDALDEFFFRLLRAELDTHIQKNWSDLLNILLIKLINYQSKSKAFEVGEKHYDLGNDLFKAMLDKNMIYSCAYWKRADTLDQAQEDKLDLICKKIHLKPGMKVLDIGCGWGGFAEHAARNYGAEVVGLTISKEQVAHAQQAYPGLKITIRLQDYRDCHELFDRIVSVGMFEHVGHKNYPEFMNVVHRCLKDDGLCLLHTIGSNKTYSQADPWTSKHIFPNGILPSLPQICNAIEGLFIVEDLHNFGADYDKTLMAWHQHFIKAWPSLSNSYDQRFYRMWCYYLLSCAGFFRARGIQLWQLVLSKKGLLNGYTSLR